MYVSSLPKVGAPPAPAPLREIALEDGAQSDLIWVVSGARCLLIVGLCLFVTGVVNAQTLDPSPVDAHDREYGPRLALSRDLKTGAFCATHPNGSILTTG